jgi:hypothetical protein
MQNPPVVCFLTKWSEVLFSYIYILDDGLDALGVFGAGGISCADGRGHEMAWAEQHEEKHKHVTAV